MTLDFAKVRFDALHAEVDAPKRLQAETAAELDALLPAILDRAFKGENVAALMDAYGLSLCEQLDYGRETKRKRSRGGVAVGVLDAIA